MNQLLITHTAQSGAGSCILTATEAFRDFNSPADTRGRGLKTENCAELVAKVITCFLFFADVKFQPAVDPTRRSAVASWFGISNIINIIAVKTPDNIIQCGVRD